MSPSRIFLLSPADCNGTRAKQILSPKAQFSLAVELRSRRGAMLGDVFAFVSGLYFRGKLTYAVRFAGFDGVYVITPNAGLRRPDTYITHKALRTFADGDIHHHIGEKMRRREVAARLAVHALDRPADQHGRRIYRLWINDRGPLRVDQDQHVQDRRGQRRWVAAAACPRVGEVAVDRLGGDGGRRQRYQKQEGPHGLHLPREPL